MFCLGVFYHVMHIFIDLVPGLPTIGAHLGWINKAGTDSVDGVILSMWIVANVVMLLSITGFAMISGAKG